MKRSNQLVLESAVIASVLIALTLGGSVATTIIPPSFASLQDPGTVKVNHDVNALANYYNTTLTKIGTKNFQNASFLLETFRFVNISPSVNATAQAANSDLATVNVTAANATAVFQQAEALVKAKQYANATALTLEGCALAQQANRSLADFQGPQTSRFKAESIPVSQYSKGSGVASAEVGALLAECNHLRTVLGGSGTAPILLIGSLQNAIETGGTVELVGNLTLGGSGVPLQEVLFYLNGSYFGSVRTGVGGDLAGTLRIPFIYSRVAAVQAFVAPNATINMGGASSNVLLFQILFNQTAIAIGDPPSVLPTFSFHVEGNLTTVTGTALPDAPVRVTFISDSVMLHTDARGAFATKLTVPANATDGVYNVYASFAPQGVFGPSFNFTSVQVVHLPLELNVSAPSLSLAGFSTTLAGTARANGSAVSGASIFVNSPWGVFKTSTDSSGAFSVSLPVSALEFSFARGVTVNATASQPFIASAAVTRSLGLFNLLLVVLPAAGIGIIGYEADRLGVFSALRRRTSGEEPGLEELVIPAVGLESATATGGPELVLAFRRALGLAARKYSIRFRQSQTIREIVSSVGIKDSGEGFTLFRDVMLTVEDFLYSERFDGARLKTANGWLARLEEVWK